MLEWIWNNKELLFSGIGGLVIVTSIGALYKHFKRSPSPQITQTPTQANTQTQTQIVHVAAPIVQVPTQIIQAPPQIVQVTPIETPIKEHKIITQVTSLEIFDAFKKLPLLQQEDCKKHYIGIRVSWTGRLLNAHRRESADYTNISLRMLSGEYSHCVVVFHVLNSRYPDLGLLHQDAPINVIGIIKYIETGYIELSDADISFSLTDPSK